MYAKKSKYIHFNRRAAYPTVGPIRGESLEQIPGLDLCQEQTKDQELNSAGTELNIKFVIVTVIEFTVAMVQNVNLHIKNLCPHIQKITPPVKEPGHIALSQM